jgi:hypothetical protein
MKRSRHHLWMQPCAVAIVDGTLRTPQCIELIESERER